MSLKDTVRYGIENGFAQFTVSRTREGSVEQVYIGKANTLAGALVSLMDYEGQCIRANSQGRTHEYFGAGPERGEWEDRQLNSWELDPNCPLLDEERKLVNGIVAMHNGLVSRVSDVVRK